MEPDGLHRPPRAPPWVVDRLQFKQDYIGYLDRRRTHLYVLNVDTGKQTQLTFGDYDDSQPAWSPDGQRIAFVSNRTEEPDINYNTDIWVVDVDRPAEPAKPAKEGKLTRITTNPGPDRSPAWSPDGQSIYFLLEDSGELNLASISAGGGSVARIVQ